MRYDGRFVWKCTFPCFCRCFLLSQFLPSFGKAKISHTTARNNEGGKHPILLCRCALHLIKEDPSEFLRRCCIICVEDSILHPALPLLVWLMAAHAKGYAMTHSQASRCLAVVYHMAHSPVKDHLDKVCALCSPRICSWGMSQGWHSRLFASPKSCKNFCKGS